MRIFNKFEFKNRESLNLFFISLKLKFLTKKYDATNY